MRGNADSGSNPGLGIVVFLSEVYLGANYLFRKKLGDLLRGSAVAVFCLLNVFLGIPHGKARMEGAEAAGVKPEADPSLLIQPGDRGVFFRKENSFWEFGVPAVGMESGN